MKKLKIILQSNFFYYALIGFLIVYVVLFTIIIRYESVYQQEKNIVGKVIKYEIEEDKISFIIKGKEKVKGVYYTDTNKDIKIGSILKIKGEITTASSNTVPNTFNYKKYLYNNKIYKIVKVKSLVVDNTNINFFEKIKNFAIKRCNNNPYLYVFIIGDKSLLNDGLYKEYQEIGISHLLAVSGMHISVLIVILSKILFFLKKDAQKIFTLLFLFLYSYIVSFSASILRAIIFYLLSYINKKYLLKISNLKILLLTATILIIFNPFIIYDIGFQYSFLIVLGIILVKKYLSNNYFKNIVIISFYSMIFTLPITINLNFEINIFLLISNILFIPLITFIIYPLAIITFVVPSFIPFFNLITNFLSILVTKFSKISFLTFNIPQISIIEIIIYYLILYGFFYFNSKKILILLLVLIISIKLKCFITFSSYVYYFDVGQGDLSVIITPLKKDVIMIDTGGLINSNNNYYVSDKVILFLKSIGITRIDLLIITHGDSDHAGDAINVINNMTIKQVVINCGSLNYLEKKIMKVLHDKNIKYNNCIKRYEIKNTKIYFLNNFTYDDENDNSAVIYLKINNYKFLFMGDAGIEVEKYIIKNYLLKDIFALKVGHHGSKTSSSPEFINTINPKYAIISVGKNNIYNHPNSNVLSILNKSLIYRTDVNGTVVFKITKESVRVKTYAP